jgi:hypothetical protein
MQAFLDSLSLAGRKMLDASFTCAPEPEKVEARLLCEGRGEGGAEEGAAAPFSA